MAQEIGLPYIRDRIDDPSGFLARARLHQSTYRAVVLDVPCDKYGNYLQKADAWDRGLNFYDDFGVFDAVKEQCPSYSRQLYANLLRSEHIPFNLFIPLGHDPNFCKAVLSELMELPIRSVDKIKIEYAPKPARRHLDDRTSFDVYVEYGHEDGTRGILGIEVKYTERSYKLQKKSKEEAFIDDPQSKYYSVTAISRLYRPDAIPLLKTDRFRQIWRNQLLGESILIADKDEFGHFTSVALFPEGNTHFIEASKEYSGFLARNDHKFLPVTYERFFDACEKYCPDDRYDRWIAYLRNRYIVTAE